MDNKLDNKCINEKPLKACFFLKKDQVLFL